MSALTYPWLQPLWQHLSSYIQQQRVPQALLIHGTRNGQRALIEHYAQRLLCTEALPEQAEACGTCHACQMYAAQTHPDYLVVEPDEPGKVIGIDKIRQLVAKLALKPHSSAYRVALIQPADDLNTASANAFLKYLEEPTERTCLILLGEQPARLPATIRSRCQQIASPQVNRAQALQWLQSQGVTDQTEALLDLAQGAPLLAKQYADRGLLATQQACLSSFLELAQGRNNLIQVVEQWLKQNVPPNELLSWMAQWISELIQLQNGITIQQPQPGLQALAKGLDLTRLYQLYDDLLKARSQLSTTLNKQLMLEQILINWILLHTR